MPKYLKQGFPENEKLLYLVDVITPEDVRYALAGLGVDARSKQYDCHIADAAPAYCPGGHFDCEEMLDPVRAFYRDAAEQGYDGARGTGESETYLVKYQS